MVISNYFLLYSYPAILFFSPKDDKDNIFLSSATLGTVLVLCGCYLIINFNNFGRKAGISSLVKEASHKKPHIVWLLLSEMVRIETESRLMVARAWGPEGIKRDC